MKDWKKWKRLRLRLKLSKTYYLCPGLVWRIEVAAVQFVVLYRVELWSKSQKNHEQKLQKLINRQAWLITGMYRSLPISYLINDFRLLLPHILLDTRQQVYALWIINLTDWISTKDIFPIILQSGDGNAQPEDLPEYDLVWTINQRIRTYEQHFAG